MLTHFELSLAASLLDDAGDRFSDDGCTDLNVVDEFGLSEKEAIELDRKINDWNTSPEEHDPVAASCGGQHNWVLMVYMASRLEEEAAIPAVPKLPEWSAEAAELLREVIRPIGCFMSKGARCDCLWCRAQAHIASLTR